MQENLQTQAAEEIEIMQRVEKKFRMTQAQKNALMTLIEEHLTPNMYFRSTICSLYLDTPDNRLIRTSMEGNLYKEKLRLRSYGVPQKDTRVFLEIKKKAFDIVGKRRAGMTLEEAETYFSTGKMPFDSQIMREIEYAMNFYGRPQPKMLICYEREAWDVIGYPELRVTFDENIRYRTSNLSLSLGTAGHAILPHDEVLMEIKTDGAIPVWFAQALDTLNIRQNKFSKYGTAYQIEHSIPVQNEIIREDFRHAGNF